MIRGFPATLSRGGFSNVREITTVNTRYVTSVRGASFGEPRPYRWLIIAALLAIASPVFAQIQPGQLATDNPATASTASAPDPAATMAVSSHQPMSGAQRFRWFAEFTFGPEALTGEAFNAGVGTWEDRPRENGRSWTGFGNRFGIGLSGDVVSNGIEAGLGAIWGEDPRYFREGKSKAVTSRMGNVFVMTFFAENSRGETVPAYARLVAIPSSNFISNAWREPSEANASSALLRTGLGFLGRMGSNAFTEFWPDIHQALLHR